MSAKEIQIPGPTDGVASWRQPFRLDGVAGSLGLEWNEPGQMWLLHVYDAEGGHIAGPRAVHTHNKNLLRGLQGLAIPPGRLIVRAKKRFPGFDAFETDASLYYIKAG